MTKDNNEMLLVGADLFVTKNQSGEIEINYEFEHEKQVVKQVTEESNVNLDSMLTEKVKKLESSFSRTF